ncbi:MBL fold metallo-hydrolase [Desulfitibacter alkalitolerans]|uniref:MBL fold metallo-hydrolase n=1 Tax=Desulfitibacter alkalitolerans TaxID=264641 RepID=UPI000686CD7A|nr:MBL fold metallo-hydrolase [Desulfitibacter alkalitolerans]
MNKPSISVTFFYHSCVAVESAGAYLLFDYFSRKPPVKIPFPANKKIYIFSSHGHGDHYSPYIFRDGFTPGPAFYILSHDIEDVPKDKPILWVEPYQTYTLDNLTIKTFGTTDVGVSFLVSIDGFQLFHSGDLNWWHWEHFNKEDQELERVNYQNEAARLSKHSIDLAFVPVDPRLGDASYLAAHYFIDKLKPRYLVPIHLQTDFQVMKDFAQTADPVHTHVLTFGRIGETKKLQP